MTDAVDSHDRPPADPDDTPDWDLSVAAVADSAACDAALPAAELDKAREIAASDEAVEEDVDDPSSCYQTHFLDDDEPEAEFVAHVEQPINALAQPVPLPDLEIAAIAHAKEVARFATTADPLTSAMVSNHLHEVAASEAEPEEPAAEPSNHPSEASAAEDAGELDAVDDAADQEEAVAVTAVAAYAEPDAATGNEELADDGLLEAGIADVVYDDANDPDLDEQLEPAAAGGGWTIPLVCLGIAIIAFCMVIPQADANRRLAYERASLRADLESIQTQVATNDEFLRKLASDPTLAERLAQRQLNLQRAGTRALSIGLTDTGVSPFDLVKVSPPPAMKPYEPLGGKLASVCREGRSRLRMLGVGLFVLAAGLILGIAPPPRQ